jgi:hypothetical protein
MDTAITTSRCQGGVTLTVNNGILASRARNWLLQRSDSQRRNTSDTFEICVV